MIVSCHLSGGCFQYSNAIISRMALPADVYVPEKVAEPSCLQDTHTFKLWGYPTILRYLSLAWLMVKIFVLGLTGYYKSMVLFGYAGWDYFVMRAWKLTGRPSYFVVHDGKMHDGEQNAKLQAQLVYLMRSATYLVFLSEFVRGGVSKCFNICKPSCIVPHGLIDYGDAEPRPQAEKPVLLFLGRVSKYKGIDVLLSAMQKVPWDVYSKLIIAGKWDGNASVPVSSEKIEIVDKFLSTDEILPVIEKSDVMLFPYTEASQSGVATLALNYQKPSVVTEVGAFREQFTERSAVFVQPNDAGQLAEAIERVCRDLELRRRMADELGKERKKFEWDHIAHKLEAYIQSHF